jgi:hypothetical protein
MTGGGETAEEAAIVSTGVPAVMAEGAGPGAPAPVALGDREDPVVRVPADMVGVAVARARVDLAVLAARVPVALVIADRAVPVRAALAAGRAPVAR